MVHVEVDVSEIGKNVPAHIPIVGDAKLVLQALLEELVATASIVGQA